MPILTASMANIIITVMTTTMITAAASGAAHDLFRFRRVDHM